MTKYAFDEKQKYLKKVLKFLDINSKVVLKIRKIGDKRELIDGKIVEKNKPHKFIISIDKDCRNWRRVIIHEVVHIIFWHCWKTMSFVNKELDKKANILMEKQIDQWVRFIFSLIK